MTQKDRYLIYSPKDDIFKTVYKAWHEAFIVADRKANEEDLPMYILKIDTIVKPKEEINIYFD